MPKTRSGARNGSEELNQRTRRNQKLNSRDSLAYASSVEALKSALHEIVGGACGLVDSPKAVCEHQPKLVQDFFECLQRLNPAVSPSRDQSAQDVAQKFRDAVTYYPTGDGRARIFFTLIDLGVEDDSDTWANFVKSLHILKPENANKAFADSNLPFREFEFVKGLIGPEHAAEFQRQQYKYCPPLTQDFSGKLKDLKTLITKNHITCLRCRNTDDCHVDHNEHIETFCPDSAPSELIEQESDLVKDIYTESEKTKILNSCIQDPATHYEAWKKAEQVAERFLKGLKSRSKIFVILVDIGFDPSSESWNKFTRLCLDESLLKSRFDDSLLPISSVRQIGENIGHEVAHSFCDRQYIYCPSIIREYQYPEKLNRRRLPFREKTEIGHGGFGTVFCVKIVSKHLLDREGKAYHEDEELAMKVVNPQETDELGKLRWLVDQPRTHRNLMRVRASLETQDRILIFFQRAKYSLDDYMRKENPTGPKVYNDRLKLLGWIYEIADAILYLHKDLRDDTNSHFACYHKDIKSENILMVDIGGELHPQISDFGISSIQRNADSSSIYERLGYSGTPLTTRQRLTENQVSTVCQNVAPEALFRKINAKADIWSLGVFLSENVTYQSGGVAALIDFEQKRKGILKDITEERSFGLTDDGIPFLKTCIVDWFEKLIKETRERGSKDDLRLYESYWRLLKEKLLVCDEIARASIEEVNDILKNISQELPASDVIKITSPLPRTPSDKPLPPMPPAIPREDSLQTWPSPSTANTNVQRYTSPPASPSPKGHSFLKRLITRRKRERRNPSDSHNTNQPINSAERDMHKVMKAVEEGDTELALKYIIEFPDTHKFKSMSGPVLHAAIEKGMVKVVEAILERGTDPNVTEGGFAPIQRAVDTEEGNADDIVRSLLLSNADIEVEDDSKSTPLLVALRNRREKAAKALMKHGANALVSDVHSCTPLHFAIHLPTTDITAELLHDHPDLIDKPTGRRLQTALHLCAEQGTAESYDHAKLLLEHRSDPNARDYDNHTPLYLVTKKDKTDSNSREGMARLLLEHGANVRVTLEKSAWQYDSIKEYWNRPPQL